MEKIVYDFKVQETSISIMIFCHNCYVFEKWCLYLLEMSICNENE